MSLLDEEQNSRSFLANLQIFYLRCSPDFGGEQELGHSIEFEKAPEASA